MNNHTIVRAWLHIHTCVRAHAHTQASTRTSAMILRCRRLRRCGGGHVGRRVNNLKRHVHDDFWYIYNEIPQSSQKCMLGLDVFLKFLDISFCINSNSFSDVTRGGWGQELPSFFFFRSTLPHLPLPWWNANWKEAIKTDILFYLSLSRPSCRSRTSVELSPPKESPLPSFIQTVPPPLMNKDDLSSERSRF